MRGEYWIDENGDVDFADGDIGDRNHEGIVIDRVARMIITLPTTFTLSSDKISY